MEARHCFHIIDPIISFFVVSLGIRQFASHVIERIRVAN